MSSASQRAPSTVHVQAPDIARPPVWRIGGASVRGRAHARHGLPNQDAMTWTPDGGAGVRIVGAVSDGHGSAPHYRSDIGARFAVDTAAELVGSHLDNPAACGGDHDLAAEIPSLWRLRVERHLLANPLSAIDVLLLNGSPYAPYGATLIAVGADNDRLVMLQIGDGDLMLGFADGRIERPLPVDEELVGEQTWSLCLDGAEARFRLAAMRRSDTRPLPDFILLASDGVSKSYRNRAALDAEIRTLRRQARHDWARAIAALPHWLETLSDAGSGDDCTACMAVRPASGAGKGEGDRR